MPARHPLARPAARATDLITRYSHIHLTAGLRMTRLLHVREGAEQLCRKTYLQNIVSLGESLGVKTWYIWGIGGEARRIETNIFFKLSVHSKLGDTNHRSTRFVLNDHKNVTQQKNCCLLNLFQVESPKRNISNILGLIFTALKWI